MSLLKKSHNKMKGQARPQKSKNVNQMEAPIPINPTV
jgi:hypothetical protein